MELAFIECLDQGAFKRVYRPSAQTHVFCIAKDRFPAPADSTELNIFDFHGPVSGKLHFFFHTDMEIGFALHCLEKYDVKVYTSREDVSPYRALGLEVEQEPRDIDTETKEGVQEALFQELQEKFNVIFQTNPRILAPKRDSAIAQIRNLAHGLVISFRTKHPLLTCELPSTDALAERLYSTLLAKDVIIENLGQVKHFEYQQSKPRPMTPPDLLSSLVQKAKADALAKYVEKFLSNSVIRAAKEKSAWAQLNNLVRGAFESLRVSHGAQIELPEPAKITNEMFPRLKTVGAIGIMGATVVYYDAQIQELRKDESLQRTVCGGLSEPSVLDRPIDSKELVFMTAFKTYYDGVLLHLDLAAKTEKGVREQIKNIVSNAIKSAASQRSGDLSQVYPERVAEVIYKVLVRYRVISASVTGLKYNRGEIDSLGGKFGELVCFAEALSVKELDESAKLSIETDLLRVLSDHRPIKLGDLFDICAKQVAAKVKFADLLMSEADIDSLAIAILTKVASNSPTKFRFPIEDLEVSEVFAHIQDFRSLELNSIEEDETELSDA